MGLFSARNAYALAKVLAEALGRTYIIVALETYVFFFRPILV
jgi:hypothetical protein